MYAKHLLLIAISGILFGVFGYYLGTQNAFKHMQKDGTWKKMDTEFSSTFLQSALEHGAWSNVSQQVARDTLPFHLDASNIPDGDMAVSSKKIHSGRYIISQWQRAAAGASVVVLGRDAEQDLCIALGTQRGNLVIVQGYMETYLPQEDLTGLGKKGASRINSSTGELIYADNTFEDTAVREVKEELGIEISKNFLKLLAIFSGKDIGINLHLIEGTYGIILPNVPELGTLDTECVEDDMQYPFWVKVKNIKCTRDNCYVPNNNLPIEKRRIPSIQQAIKELGTDSDQKECKSFLSLNIE